MKTLALFGGTFDPIHNGHLRMALELKQRLQLDEMRLLPSHRPPHRDQPGCSSAERAAMVELAVADCAALQVDRRELERDSPSYMVDTLAEVRQELGDGVSLILAMGMDSLINLSKWYCWQALTDYAHLLVVTRPGYCLPTAGPIAELVQRCGADASALQQFSHGRVVITTQTLLPISATEIRDLIGRGLSPEFLLPTTVWRYIQRQQLYGAVFENE